ncbi:hemolysin XhlA family protein [Clostridium sp. HBUAS56017]|uniref:hemolysin XhlA family protein n=1 Tax=Clostridium sp. HBUAS56017 TaxID=2571128 RepID=UPI0011787594|nr:hemolysin XhlA family protein [Clostridium sp. HBUAS56017]
MDQQETIQDIKERLVRIETLLENSQSSTELKVENLDEKIKVVNHRIQDLENTISWLTKTAIGALIAGAIGILFGLSKII